MIPLQIAPTQEPIYRREVDDTAPVWARWFAGLVNAFNNLTATGTTAQRPSPAPFIGFMYFDTTINKPIWAKTLTQYVYSDGTNA